MIGLKQLLNVEHQADATGRTFGNKITFKQPITWQPHEINKHRCVEIKLELIDKRKKS